MTATSWQTWLVAASSRVEAVAGRSSQSSLRPKVGHASSGEAAGGGGRGGRRRVVGRAGCGGGVAEASGYECGASDRGRDIDGVEHAPGPPLGAQFERGLDEERIDEQPAEGSDIRERVQPIRGCGGVGRGEPGLEEGAGGGEEEVREPHADAEHEEDREDGVVVPFGLPAGIGGDGRAPAAGQQCQEDDRGGEEQGVEECLASGCEPGQEVCVGIAGEQQELEEQHAG